MAAGPSISPGVLAGTLNIPSERLPDQPAPDRDVSTRIDHQLVAEVDGRVVGTAAWSPFTAA